MINQNNSLLRSSFLRFLSGIMIVHSLGHAQQPHNFVWPDVPKTGLGAGMTVCTIDAKELTDYINSNSAASQTIPGWNIAGEFSLAPEFHLSEALSLKIEYAYLIGSHSIDDPLSGGKIDFSYGVHMPSVILQYMYIDSRGFFLKFGGGFGYYFALLNQKFPSFLGTTQSSANGVGMKLDVSGQTPLSENLYLKLGTGMRLSFVGKFHGGVFDTPSGSTRSVSMNFISIGATLGLIYFF